MKVGYLPLITKGGGVFGEVFDWQSTIKIIDETLKLFNEIDVKVSYIGKPISIAEDWENSEILFAKDKIDIIFVHTLNIVGGELLFKMINKRSIPEIISAVPQRDGLYRQPYTSRYASYCGAQWNTNMCYLANIKSKFIFGSPAENKFKEELRIIIKAIDTVNKIKEWKVCVVGDKTPGYYGAIYSEDLLMRKFGSRVVYLDFGMLKLNTKNISNAEVDDFYKKYYRKEEISKDLSIDHINNTIRAYLALEEYARNNEINSYTMKCFPETLFLLGACPCGINSILTEKGYISGCEGDVLTTLTMEIAYLLSGEKPLQVDIMSIREKNNSVLLWHCGAGAPSIAGKNKITYNNSSILGGDGKKQGVSVDFIPEYKSTNMCALVEDWKTNNYKFFTADGNSVETEPFIGGNPIKIKFNVEGEKLGYYITDNHLPHHFQIVGKNISKYIEEFSYWKDIELLQV